MGHVHLTHSSMFQISCFDVSQKYLAIITFKKVHQIISTNREVPFHSSFKLPDLAILVAVSNSGQTAFVFENQSIGICGSKDASECEVISMEELSIKETTITELVYNQSGEKVYLGTDSGSVLVLDFDVSDTEVCH